MVGRMNTKSIEEMIGLAREHALPLLEMQQIAEVGLGDTLADILAAGYVRASLTESRDANGRLTMDPSDPFFSNGFARWHQGGLPRIRLSHGLAAKLAMTDPKGIAPEELKLPFPCFMIDLPHPDGPIVMDENGRQSDVLTLLAFWYMNSTKVEKPKDHVESIAELLADLHRVKRTTSWNLPQLRAILLAGQASEQTWIPLDRPLAIPEHADAVGVSRLDRRAAVLTMRIIVNLALYLKYVDTSVTPGGGRVVNHDHGLQSLFYEVGNEVKLDRPIRDAARSFCMSGEAHKKWKLDKRFIVRGHWKQQAHGSCLGERRLQFIEPYWKGPADAPVLARVYVDSEDEEK